MQPTASGGAVVDATGHVVGIATSRFARFGAIAIPAATVNNVVETLLENGRIPRGYLGVGLQAIRLPDTIRQLLQCTEKTAAIRSGVRAVLPADVSADQLNSALEAAIAGFVIIHPSVVSALFSPPTPASSPAANAKSSKS